MVLLRVPFLHQAIQGDDVYYLYGAEHAQIDPLHPNHARYLFLGDMVDMRGHSHPPLNEWILGALLGLLGDVREEPFHLSYILFSVIAALAMWSLARRFCGKPFLATLLFIAVPAFVVNGNSLEADLPFLAFWMSAIALFVYAIDEQSRIALVGAALAAALAALAAYQAIFLAPILAVYLFEKQRGRVLAWCVVLTAPATLGVWQLYERLSSGELPAAVLAGYMHDYAWQALAQKTRNAVALAAHLGWVVPPLLVAAGFWRDGKWRWITAAVAAAAACIYDPHTMFWASFGCGVLVLAAAARRGFLEAWILVFFAGALLVFFAGSARYLLPVAAPVAILAVRACSARLVIAGFALQMAISLGLAIVNYQHWAAYRQFAHSLQSDVQQHRVWINGEWGLRYYFESEGALPMPKGQVLQTGEIVVSSALALPLRINAALSPLARIEIRPPVPLRITSLEGRSAYSVASRGLRPFEFSRAAIDRVCAQMVVERAPQLTYIDPRDAQAAPQIAGGLYPDGWMTEQATVLLKAPAGDMPLRVALYIPPNAPARHVRLTADNRVLAEQTFPGPGAYTISAPVAAFGPAITVTVSIDATFSAPPDRRKLGMIITGIGFRSGAP